MANPLRWLLLVLTCTVLVAAQDSSTSKDTQASTTPSEGPAPGAYSVSQSIEFGGRIADFTGNPATRDTLVDLHSGPRLLSQWLEITTPRGTGQLFDQLSISSFGFGGDPNSVARARVSKDRWYKFSALFRRDKNFFDYNLLANPLNPLGSNPTVIIGNSPHKMENVRRMSDLGLTILPQNWFSVRLGYGSVNNEGPTFSTVHQGTEALLGQNFRNATYTYRGGVDLRWPRKTIISYDQIFTLNKADTTWDLSLLPLQLANGTPVDLGIAFNTVAGQPCAAPIANAGTTPPTANAACNGYTGYQRRARTRTFFPTEQLSLQTSVIPHVDFSSRFVYSGAESDLPNTLESYLGLSTRTRVRDLDVTGPVYVKRVNVTADAGVTVHFTERFRLTDSFRWSDFRIPGNYNSQEASLFAATMLLTPNVYNPATCATVSAPGCPQHLAASPADLIVHNYGRFLGQDAKTNTVELEYDFTHWVGAHIGYRIRNRLIELKDTDLLTQTFFPTLPNRGACAGKPLVNGVCTVASATADSEEWEINEHSGLFGFWLRPNQKFRLSYDMELMSADNSFTRISPRKRQDYWIRGSYKPVPWANFSSSIKLGEMSNDQADVNNFQHLRTYNFNLNVSKSERWGLDVGYSLQDIFSQSDICFVGSPVVPTTSCGTPFLRTISFYDVDDHYGDVHVYVKPVKKLTADLGYTVTSTSGMTTTLNTLQPAGPLAINYHLPQGSLEYEFTKNWTGRAAWNHYGYNEKSDPGLTVPRDMRGNVYTLSVRFTTGERSK